MKLVLFDCDGTLVDSAGIIHECMRRTFDEAGIALPSDTATRQIIGLSLDVAIARLLGRENDGTVETLTRRYKDHFVSMRSEPGFREPLYEGIKEVINVLSARADVVLGMVTGKSRRGVRAVFTTHGFADKFLIVRTADDCPSKPNPAMVLECCAETGIDAPNTVVIGDAIYDIEMALAAGAHAIGVSWGYHKPMALTQAGAGCIARSPGDILKLL